MQLKLKQEHRRAMLAHVERTAPFESCGLLAGKGDRVEKVLPITNQAHSPTRYRMQPEEQLRAFNEMEIRGLDLVGIFHSHPSGPEGPSPTDIEEAAYPVVQVIWFRSNGRWQMKGFRIHRRSFDEVILKVLAEED